MKKAIVSGVIVLIILLFASCDMDSIFHGNTTVRISVKPLTNKHFLDNGASRALLSFNEQTLSLKAEADGMTPITQTLAYDSAKGAFSGSVSIEKGKIVTFTVEAKDAKGSVYVKGTETKTLEKSSEKVTITLVPVLSDATPKGNELIFTDAFEGAVKGEVKAVSFAPVMPFDLTYTFEALNVAVTVCNREGKSLINENNEWGMKKGEEVIILYTKTGENPMILVYPRLVTVHFDANGGTGTMENQFALPSVQSNLTKNTFTKEGFAFSGWNTTKDGKGTSYSDEATVKLSADTTLYAQWKQDEASVQKVTVTFNANGGGGSMSPQEISKGVETQLTENNFSKTGCIFNVWNTEKDGTGTTYVNKESVSLSADVTLYAQWTLLPLTDTIVNIASIQGVTIPLTGAIPKISITETTQYTGKIDWSGSPDVFAANTVYTATITLTAKAGYTLTGTAVDFFTVPGASSDTNAANNGVIVAVFPATYEEDFISATIGSLKYVPAGSFQRDATSTNISVITQSYRMSETEITREQFNTVMGTDPSLSAYSSNPTSTSDPVQNVNWYQIIAFCNKLSLLEGLTPIYEVTGVNFSTLTFAEIPTSSNADWDAVTIDWSGNGYRLPTEMEWMWASMGAPADGQDGGINTTGYTKAFAGSTGNNLLGDYAVYGASDDPKNDGQTTKFASNPVGSKLPNELGLYDMSGNAREWCWDINAAYPSGTLTDYRGASTNTMRVKRSGAWNGSASSCTVAYRGTGHPYDHYVNDGFRVVITGTPEPATVINISAIPGVTVPVVGAEPVTTITETDQYTGTVAWNGTPTTFAYSTAYTATITLTAKTGYKLSGVTANFFTVAGATSVTNSASTGTVTAVFPSAASYVSANIGNLMLVTGGTFNNGTADMTVSSFRMSQYEITMEQFVEVTGLTNTSTYFTRVVNGPVQNVNWYHALVFCNTLSIAEGLTPVYTISSSTDPDDWGTIPTSNSITWNAVTADWSATGYRLPTEAEWQFAARGGNSSNNYTYAGSNTIDGVAWYTSNSSYTTHTVGTKTANELGLYDMGGNVWEWCWDWYGSYPGTAQTDYRGAASGTDRVIRGGSWDGSATNCTVADRGLSGPNTQFCIFGFRVVRP